MVRLYYPSSTPKRSLTHSPNLKIEVFPPVTSGIWAAGVSEWSRIARKEYPPGHRNTTRMIRAACHGNCCMFTVYIRAAWLCLRNLQKVATRVSLIRFDASAEQSATAGTEQADLLPAPVECLPPALRSQTLGWQHGMRYRPLFQEPDFDRDCQNVDW